MMILGHYINYINHYWLGHDGSNLFITYTMQSELQRCRTYMLDCMRSERGWGVCIGNQAIHMIWEHSVHISVEGFWVGGWVVLSLFSSLMLSIALSPSEASPLTAVPANLSKNVWLLWRRIYRHDWLVAGK